MGAVEIGFRHEDLGGAAQIAVVRRTESANACVAAMPCFSSITTSIPALTTGPCRTIPREEFNRKWTCSPRRNDLIGRS